MPNAFVFGLRAAEIELSGRAGGDFPGSP
jgi:hypothetical protein